MKRFQIFLLVMTTLLVFAFNAYPQVTSIGESSEWEATGFNNGRRVVRDCFSARRGYFHYVWHSKEDPNDPPSGNKCHIFYACTDDNGNMIIPPVNMTRSLNYADNRYPSIAIENKGLDAGGSWRYYNNIHLVWQCKADSSLYYEVYHAVIKVNPPTPPNPFTPADVKNLSLSYPFRRDSLVPAIAINHYDGSPRFQSIHVVWQEEDISAGASDIVYTRSQDSGLTFSGPITSGPWDNLTITSKNSQMPSISCSLDTFPGFPLDYSGGDCSYVSKEVHVVYNEETSAGGINIFYRRSPGHGWSWDPPVNVTSQSGGSSRTLDGYPNIAADMLDNVHIVFMRGVKVHTPGSAYSAGLDPLSLDSFPGPNPGMYNTISNYIVYWSNITHSPPALALVGDREFPTVALDREQYITVNWQEWQANDYEIIRILSKNAVPPTRPISVPVYDPWGGVYNDSSNYSTDDMFPNLAHKKVSMYKGVGFTEIWTRIRGTGPGPATLPGPNTIMQKNNLQRDPAVN